MALATVDPEVRNLEDLATAGLALVASKPDNSFASVMKQGPFPSKSLAAKATAKAEAPGPCIYE